MTLDDLKRLDMEAATLDGKIQALQRALSELDTQEAAYDMHTIIHAVMNAPSYRGLIYAQGPLREALDAIKTEVLLVVKLQVQKRISDLQMQAAQKRCVLRASIVPLPMAGAAEEQSAAKGDGA